MTVLREKTTFMLFATRAAKNLSLIHIFAKQIDRAKEAGADGVVLYAVDHLTGENAKAEMANAVPELERFKEAQQN